LEIGLAWFLVTAVFYKKIKSLRR